MHADNIDWAGPIDAWRRDPGNKALQVAGDDRSPPFTWISYLYVEDGKVVIPSDNLMTVLREGGAQISFKGKKTFKAQTQSGLIIDQSSWPLVVNGKEIPYSEIEPLVGEPSFKAHEDKAKSLGFALFTKRAKIGSSKHVRVRPRFDNWSCSGTITVLDQTITSTVLEQILKFAGAYSGLCDWRPSSKTPGRFGRFDVQIKPLE